MTDAISAETVTIRGHGQEELEAYFAQPLDGGRRGNVVVIHHMPGYDRGQKEIVRRFAVEGYYAVCPNLFSREASGAAPDDASAIVRARGGVPDYRLLGDIAGAAEFLSAQPHSNQQVATIGFCSGGRQSFLAACELDIDAAIDCYGAFVANATPKDFPLTIAPVLDRASNIMCPILGLFGKEDRFPDQTEVDVTAAELSRLGKDFECYSYENAGHGFFDADRPSYRPEAAVAGWQRIRDFLERTIGKD